ncbi:hypothetical protein [Novosphingobium album (ex Liu et al. 2023)]|uniref:hypothetical protein n=1 Tax=Novosphingobium album (ex Liu et al. 2023) TaxID=3031130 RepID=UPI0023AF8391|nr:hypothetical protein [Novosphingobium album (ex Liu et al. 2023)]
MLVPAANHVLRAAPDIRHPSEIKRLSWSLWFESCTVLGTLAISPTSSYAVSPFSDPASQARPPKATDAACASSSPILGITFITSCSNTAFKCYFAAIRFHVSDVHNHQALYNSYGNEVPLRRKLVQIGAK